MKTNDNPNGFPPEMIVATLAAYGAMRNVTGRRDVIAAYALAHLFSDVREVRIVRVQISVTPKSKQRPAKDWTRYAVLLDGKWLLDPVLGDLDSGDKFLPPLMMVPMEGKKAAYTDFRRFRILYSVCSEQEPANLEETLEARWMPVAESVYADLVNFSEGKERGSRL